MADSQPTTVVENWKPVVGFEELYEVSDLGNLRGKDRIIGYRVARLCKDGKLHRPKLHRIVMEAFVGPRPPKMDCCHANGDKSDNRLCNLRWDAREGNMQDSVRNGAVKKGSGHHNSILTETTVRELRKDIAALEKKYGVKLGTMMAVQTGRIWGHVK